MEIRLRLLVVQSSVGEFEISLPFDVTDFDRDLQVRDFRGRDETFAQYPEQFLADRLFGFGGPAFHETDIEVDERRGVVTVGDIDRSCSTARLLQLAILMPFSDSTMWSLRKRSSNSVFGGTLLVFSSVKWGTETPPLCRGWMPIYRSYDSPPGNASFRFTLCACHR